MKTIDKLLRSLATGKTTKPVIRKYLRNDWELPTKFENEPSQRDAAIRLLEYLEFDPDEINELIATHFRQELTSKYAQDATILITGGVGVGKTTLAKKIHNQDRPDKPFVNVNCSELSSNPQLARSELFGHKKGAFTGAEEEKKGLFETAADGDIFLDEIQDLGPALQGILLKVIDERTYTPVGSNEASPLEARIIAASNINLDNAVEDGSFRPDLLSRLKAGGMVDLGTITGETDQIQIVVDQYLSELGGDIKISYPALHILQSANWSEGNIRELKTTIKRARERAIEDGSKTIEAHHIQKKDSPKEYIKFVASDELEDLDDKTVSLVVDRALYAFRAEHDINDVFDAEKIDDVRGSVESALQSKAIVSARFIQFYNEMGGKKNIKEWLSDPRNMNLLMHFNRGYDLSDNGLRRTLISMLKELDIQPSSDMELMSQFDNLIRESLESNKLIESINSWNQNENMSSELNHLVVDDSDQIIDESIIKSVDTHIDPDDFEQSILDIAADM